MFRIPRASLRANVLHDRSSFTRENVDQERLLPLLRLHDFRIHSVEVKLTTPILLDTRVELFDDLFGRTWSGILDSDSNMNLIALHGDRICFVETRASATSIPATTVGRGSM